MIASERIDLLSNETATGAAHSVQGGNYIWSASATWSGSTATLQFLGPDGTTWISILGAVLTANGSVSVLVGNGASLRVLVAGGPPTAMYSTLLSARE